MASEWALAHLGKRHSQFEGRRRRFPDRILPADNSPTDTQSYNRHSSTCCHRHIPPGTRSCGCRRSGKRTSSPPLVPWWYRTGADSVLAWAGQNWEPNWAGSSSGRTSLPSHRFQSPGSSPPLPPHSPAGGFERSTDGPHRPQGRWRLPSQSTSPQARTLPGPLCRPRRNPQCHMGRR